MTSIAVVVNGGQYTLGFDDSTKEISFDGKPALIRSSTVGVVILRGDDGTDVQVDSKDFYRLFHGGVDPSPALAGSLIANDLLAKQQERAIFAQLWGHEVTLRSDLPCAYALSDNRCRTATRKGLIADHPTILGAFIVVPCCKNHAALMQKLLADKAGLLSSSMENEDIVYPVGTEG